MLGETSDPMNLPFEQFTIHALRGVRDLELTGLGRVNLLVGENDSGKTTVLEGLTLYCNPLDPVIWGIAAENRTFRSLAEDLSEDEELRWLFPQEPSRRPDDEYKGQVRLSATGAYFVRSMRAQYKQVRGLHSLKLSPPAVGRTTPPEQSPAATERRGAEVQIDVELAEPTGSTRASNSFTLWEGQGWNVRGFDGPSIPRELISPYDHQLTLTLGKFSEARLEGFQESVSQLLNMLDSRITGLEILAPRGRPILYLQDAQAGLAPVSVFGDGIRRALLLASVLPTLSGGVFLIDELETAIHISALGKVFRWLLDACKQFNVQLFATTHSLEALDAILAADTTPEEDIVGFRLGREGGRTVATRFGEDLLKRLRYERGLDVR